MIVEEHKKVRRELATRLGSATEVELVGVAAPGQEAIDMVEPARPDLILLDLGIRDDRGPGYLSQGCCFGPQSPDPGSYLLRR